MQLELDAGKGVEGKYFFADFTHLGEETINLDLPRTRRGCLEALALDMVYDRLPVVPGVFATLGGIAIDLHAKTRLPGLFAAGECACTGVHGADWRVGNTLLAALVFGSRAGRSAATHVGKASEKALAQTQRREEERLGEIASRSDGEPCHIIRGDLRRAMSKDVGPVRDEARLESALHVIERLKERYQKAVLWDTGLPFNQQLVGFIELGHMLFIGETVVRAALARTESRGSHWRSDFPNRDDQNWLCSSLAQSSAGGALVTHAPIQLGELKPRENVLIR
jgi:succinate dehydrogenase / fumarate reductase flavoprotein subunit